MSTRISWKAILLAAVALVSQNALADVRPAADRVDAIVGHPLVVPIVADEPGDLRQPPEVRLDDARALHVEVYRLTPAPGVDGGWIGRVARWAAVPGAEAAKAEPVPPGIWYAVVDLPIDAVSQGVWFDGVRHEVNWLPDPERASLEAKGRPLWASPVPSEARGSEPLRAALDAVAGDPFQRWRVRLCDDGIAPTGGIDRTGASGTAIDAVRADLETTDEQRFLDELARAHEARWQLILGRLALIDEETAFRVRRRLGGVVVIDGEWVPAWAPDSTDLRVLQADLLSPWVDDETRVLRARAWLDSKDKAVTWVVDDAGGELFGESRLSPTLGVLSLPARDADMLVEVAGPVGGPDFIRAPAREAVRVVASVPMVEKRGRSAAVRTNILPMRVGRTDADVEPIATVVGASPPGVGVGPLLHGWTMGALLENAPEQGAAVPVTRGTVGLIRRVAPPDDGDPSKGWSVFIRSAAPVRTKADVAEQIEDWVDDWVEDWVEVWAGPFGVPRGVWRVWRNGSVQTLFGPAPVGVEMVEVGGGWAFDLRLPESAVDPDGVLRLGMMRSLGDERTSWPRRMTPGQTEPGRLPIDTRSWSGL